MAACPFGLEDMIDAVLDDADEISFPAADRQTINGVSVRVPTPRHGTDAAIRTSRGEGFGAFAPARSIPS